MQFKYRLSVGHTADALLFMSFALHACLIRWSDVGARTALGCLLLTQPTAVPCENLLEQFGSQPGVRP